jgi:hypothetical protein
MANLPDFPPRPEGIRVNGAEGRGWGPGWPNCQQDTQVTVTRPDGLRIPLRKEIAELVALLMAETERRGYDIEPDHTGGFVCRPIRGTDRPSNHSWGLAVDINWRTNPHQDDLVTDMPFWMPELWWQYSFYWGGWYRERPDAMHYEFVGTPQDARALTVAARTSFPASGQVISNGGFASPSESDGFEEYVTDASPGQRQLRRGSAGEDVKFIQRALGFPEGQVDGLFGMDTDSAVRDFQRDNSLVPDGIVGPRTWSVLMQ